MPAQVLDYEAKLRARDAWYDNEAAKRRQYYAEKEAEEENRQVNRLRRAFGLDGGNSAGLDARRNSKGALFDQSLPQPHITITATPHVWIEPTTIPPRDFAYSDHIVRRYVGAAISTGGIGKSSELQVEIAAMITGRDLIGAKPKRQYRVWYINLEDPRDEIDRRFAAIFKHYAISQTDIGGRLFTDSGRDRNFVIARETRPGLALDQNVLADINKTIVDNGIEVVVVDPFINSVEVAENDNNKMARVIRQWADIAERHNCAVVLVHHVRKGSGQGSYTVDDTRGAGALINSCRSVRVFNLMTKAEGEKAGVERHRSYFRIDGGKSNLTPPPEASEWRKIVSVTLDNATGDCPADRVGVVTRWEWPNPFDALTVADLRAAQTAVAQGGPWRKNSQASDWVGKPIAVALDLDLAVEADRERIKAALRVWIKNKMFRVVQRPDRSRHPREYVEVDRWATDAETA